MVKFFEKALIISIIILALRFAEYLNKITAFYGIIFEVIL